MTIPTVSILNVPVHHLTADDLHHHTRRYLLSDQFHHITTVNPEFIMTAQQDPIFLDLLQQTDLNIADGIGILLAARWRGHPLPQRLPGSEWCYHLAELAAQLNKRLFLLGAAPGVAEEAATILQQRYPTLTIAGTYAGSPHPDENDHILNLINHSQADLLYVAYGAPRQDKWIHRNRDQFTTVRLALGVGGALDFITGRAIRAPRWIQNLGLEWLHRLYQEPWRWRRMLALPHFALKTLTHHNHNSHNKTK
ncbi:MAG TPA: WecB/TagA/CpsF family glycosyltransferase [Anaerolineae bacterium]|nr:WecB/TagA/CpsF family glycosyltransferase [Anaerolineae bacterium]